MKLGAQLLRNNKNPLKKNTLKTMKGINFPLKIMQKISGDCVGAVGGGHLIELK